MILATTAPTGTPTTPSLGTDISAAHPTPAETAVVTGLLTSLFAGTRLPSGDDVISARAAFQDALYGRTVLVDLRPAPARGVDGTLGIDAIVLDSDFGEAVARVRGLAESSPITLVSTDGVLAGRIAAQMRALGLTWVQAVEGGFAAWRAAGLPAHHTLVA